MSDHQTLPESTHRDFVRPRVHFTPPSGWLSDPNGLVHAHGVFHLFYQHHPDSTSWGPMHWGHATSTDLVSWHHRPIALEPDQHGMIYSGSAVVDEDGTAGVGKGALVVLFTYHRDDAEEQGLAWSPDDGVTFTKHPVPVLEAPRGQSDFRDPRVFRYEAGTGHWVMLLAAGQAVWIYTSEDLTTWTRTSAVTGVFCESGTWEMPELIPFDVDGATVWLLVVSVWDGAPAGGSGVQAVAGAFDGSSFTPSDEAFWVDHGPTFYAPQAWSCAPGGRRLWIGWMANWHTVNDLPASTWRGQMSVAREVTLCRTEAGYRLAQVPVPELARYRGRSVVAAGAGAGALLGATLPLPAPALDLVIGALPGADVTIHCNRGDESLRVRLDQRRNEITLTVASESGEDVTYRGEAAPGNDSTGIRVLLDTSSVEVFAGSATISCLLADSAAPWSVSIQTEGPSPQIERLEMHELVPAPENAGVIELTMHTL